MDSLGVLVVGCGSMGSSHARAYREIDGFHVTGVVSRGAASRYALAALQADCHLFVEKPLAETEAEAREIVATAHARRLKVVVGYILRHHPSWRTFIDHARGLGTPLVMRMNLNQQSSGAAWRVHRNLMRSIIACTCMHAVMSLACVPPSNYRTIFAGESCRKQPRETSEATRRSSWMRYAPTSTADRMMGRAW